jgi:hypothetical protein
MAGNDKEGSGRHNQQPTIAQGGGGSYIMVDTCFFGHTKNDDKNNLESLSPILHSLSFFIFSPAYFASSQFFHPLNT